MECCVVGSLHWLFGPFRHIIDALAMWRGSWQLFFLIFGWCKFVSILICVVDSYSVYESSMCS